MGCGIKAYYEELDEQIAKDKKRVFLSKDTYVVLNAIEDSIETLRRINSDPNLQLTKSNWNRLEYVLNTLVKLVE